MYICIVVSIYLYVHVCIHFILSIHSILDKFVVLFGMAKTSGNRRLLEPSKPICNMALKRLKCSSNGVQLTVCFFRSLFLCASLWFAEWCFTFNQSSFQRMVVDHPQMRWAKWCWLANLFAGHGTWFFWALGTYHSWWPICGAIHLDKPCKPSSIVCGHQYPYFDWKRRCIYGESGDGCWYGYFVISKQKLEGGQQGTPRLGAGQRPSSAHES